MTAPTDRGAAGGAPSDGGPAAAVLARSVLFAGWSADAIASVTARFQPRAVMAGEVLCRQGEPGDEMYVVEGGRFAVEATIGGRTVRFAELGPGAVFGELGILDGKPRSATVTAVTDMELAMLDREGLARLIDTMPGVGCALLSAIIVRVSERLRATNARVQQLVAENRQLRGG
jgi:CRP-like cAMP-binding protein